MDSTSQFFLQFGLILLLVLANGVFSMAEMAVVSSRKVRLQQRSSEGDAKARAALALADRPNHFLSTVQIGITLIGTLTGALGGVVLTSQVEEWLNLIPFLRGHAHWLAVALIVLVVTYISLVLGELAPKRLALSRPEDIASNLAGPMKTLSRAARPLAWLLSKSTDLVIRLLRVRETGEPPVTPEEITVLMEQDEQTGIFEQTETDIVEALFSLGDLRAGALMTPRTDIDWLDIDDSVEENLAKVTQSPHQQFPMARGGLDNVVGILRGKALLASAREYAPGSVPDLSAMIQPAQFIPESMPAFKVLEVLRGASGNLALVIDEFGGVLGMVTLFDVMEAMVGGISMRGEPLVPEAVQREDGSWLIEGMMRVDEFKKLLEIDVLPGEERAGYQTVGGFVMAQVGAVPTTGQHFECCGWRFEVLDMDGMRVDKVLASPDSGVIK